MSKSLRTLLNEIAACRHCVDNPDGTSLPHDPNPVLRADKSARIAICGQAPGTRVHSSGVPFTDPSGDRLRDWMGVSEEQFYDVQRIAIIPMGFCFPGLDEKGGDLPPRRECARLWHARLFPHLTRLDLILLVGNYAQKWHLGKERKSTLTETVRNWRQYLEMREGPGYMPLPHPSWRNNSWIKKNSWFEKDVLPRLKVEIKKRL